MTVTSRTFADFMRVVSESVQRGLTFTAEVESLTVTYTGGY
jgi:hypothetical protein